MGSNLLIGFILGLGVAGWVYAKIMRSSGNNTQSALITAGIAGLAVTFVMVALLQLFFSGE